MIITDKLNKIKVKNYVDKYTLFYIFTLIIIAICSFYLGRLTNVDERYPKEIIESQGASVYFYSDDYKKIEKTQSQNKNYVASKNGKMFYPIGCKAANRINKENMIYFNTEDEAIMSGFEFSKTCQ